MRRSGIANLPLHYGRCPPWLFQKMKELSVAITESIVNEYDVDEFLRRLSNPFFFQSFGCVVGYDWHSSGLTTTLCGALKEGVNQQECGLAILGGKGKASRKTQNEIDDLDKIFSFSSNDIENLKYASRMVAKVDTACIQAGYSLYHHTFIVSEKGSWCVIQQGMNPSNHYARRYHWLSEKVNSFVDEPHSAICCDIKLDKVLDMTAKQSTIARFASVDALKEGDYSKLKRKEELKTLEMPAHHDIVLSKQVIKALNQAREIKPDNYEELVAIKGIGPAAVRALALTANLIYSTELSWQDPAKFAFSHGGKDGYPFFVQKDLYENTINMLKQAVEEAKIGNVDKTRALRRLSDFVA